MNIINDFFATIYDRIFGVFKGDYFLIFECLFDSGSYVRFGTIFLFAPLVLWIIFYFFWNYPYGKIWHWLLWLLVIILVVFGLTYGIANIAILSSNCQDLNDALGNSSTEYEQYAKTLPQKYAVINAFLSIIVGFLYSLILKQWSKIQAHLPF